MQPDPATATPPPPGSDAAIALKCICPVIDNDFGRGFMGSGFYIFTEGCPVHPIVKADEAPA